MACASLDNSRLPSRRGVPETGTSTGPNGEASLAPDAPNRPPKGGGGASRTLAARSFALRLSDGDLSTGPFRESSDGPKNIVQLSQLPQLPISVSTG